MICPICLRYADISRTRPASPAMNAVRYPAMFGCLLSEYSTRIRSAVPSQTAVFNAHGDVANDTGVDAPASAPSTWKSREFDDQHIRA